MQLNIDNDEKYKCRKCNSTNVEVKIVGKRTGVYCLDCGAWIRWMSFKEMQKFYRVFKGTKESGNKAYKVSRKMGSQTIVKCSNCKTQLYHSGAEPPKGQFNLINAVYCPKCGMEFIF